MAYAAPRSSMLTVRSAESGWSSISAYGRWRSIIAARRGSSSPMQYTTNPSTSAVLTSSASRPAIRGTSDMPSSCCSHTVATPCSNSTAAGSLNASVSGASRITPMLPVRPRDSARACGSGPPYPSSCALASTRSRSSGESWSGRLNALDTVIRETLSAAAMVASVGRVLVICTGKDFTGTERQSQAGAGAGALKVGIISCSSGPMESA